MSKKRKSRKNSQLVGIIGALLAIAAIVVYLFMDAIKISEGVYTGVQTLFGYSETTNILFVDVTTYYFNFNIILFIVFLVLIVCALLPVFMPSKTINLVSAIGFIVVLLAIVLLPQYIHLAFTEDGFLDLLYKGANALDSSLTMELQNGAIIAAVLCGVGGACNVAGMVIK